MALQLDDIKKQWTEDFKWGEDLADYFTIGLFSFYFDDTTTKLIKPSVLEDGTSYLYFESVFDFVAGLPDIPVKGLIFDYPDHTRQLILELDIPDDYSLVKFLSPHAPSEEAVKLLLDHTGDQAFTQTLNFAKGEKLLFSSFDLSEATQLPAEVKTKIKSLWPQTIIKTGLGFAVTAQFPDAVKEVLNLFSDDKDPFDLAFDFDVHIGYSDNGEALINLSKNIGFNASIAEIGFSLDRIGIEFSAYWIGRSWPSVILEGSVTLGAKVRFYATLNWSVRTLTVGIREAIELEEATSALGLPDIGELFPGGISDLTKVAVKKLDFHLDLSGTPALDRVDLQAATTESIEIISDLIELDLLLNAQFRPRATWDKVTAQLYGSWELAGTSFNTIISYPDFVLFAQLGMGQTIDVSGLVGKLLPVDDLLPDISILDIEVTADCIHKNFDASIDIATDWDIEIISGQHFGIRQIALAVAFSSSGFQECNLNATLELFSVYFDVFGSYHLEETESGKKAGSWTIGAVSMPGSPIPIGQIMGELMTKFGLPDSDYPAALESLKFSNLYLEFNSLEKQFQFAGTLSFEIEGHEIAVHIGIDIAKNPVTKKYEKSFNGQLTIDDRVFSLYFDDDRAGSVLIADYHKEEGDKIPVRKFIESLLGESSVTDLIPESLTITIKDILLAVYIAKTEGPTTEKYLLFRLLMDLDVNLDRIPLIGPMLGSSGIRDFQLLLASKATPHTGLNAVNSGLSQITPNTPASISSPRATNTDALQRGLTLSGSLHLGSFDLPLFVNLGGKSAKKKKSGQTTTTSTTTSTTTTGSTSTSTKAISAPSKTSSSTGKPARVGKHIGPIYVKKAGLVYHDKRLGLKITGGIALAAFELELMGVEVNVPTSVFSHPEDLQHIGFNLDGMGAAIQKGTLSIMGAFMRKHYPAVDGHDAYDEYSGIIQVMFPPFMLTGMGAYAKYDGHPSLFLFVALGFPITVHPSVIITGMALGFGIHRDFIPPKLDEILTYPLVAVSVTPPPPIDLADMIEKMHHYFPPTTNQFFVVAGIKFRAIGIVNNLAMIGFKFGRAFELDLIGVSSVFLAATYIELGWLVRIVPAEGHIFMGGQLTERSYILVPMAHLTGGFAVAVWMLNQDSRHISAGDFVITLGGYHPKYPVPAHYPDHIPRLGINFSIGGILTIKGGAYMAVTPKAIMMGGGMEASLHLGPVSGYMRMSMHFIIWFQPFHFDALIGVDAGVKLDIHAGFFTIHINVHLHADMHIWGPKIAGTAGLDIGVKTIHVNFGDAGAKTPKPLGWDAFTEKFLPNNQPCSVNVTTGIIRKIKEATGEVIMVNPKELALDASSVMPFTEAAGLTTNTGDYVPGITPMAVKKYTASFNTRLIHEDTGTEVSINKKLTRSSVPAAIWGNAGLVTETKPSVTDSLMANALTGISVTPAADIEIGVSHEVDKRSFTYNTDKLKTYEDYTSPHFIATDHVWGDETANPGHAFSEFTGLADTPSALKPDGLLHDPKIVTLQAS